MKLTLIVGVLLFILNSCYCDPYTKATKIFCSSSRKHLFSTCSLEDLNLQASLLNIDIDIFNPIEEVFIDLTVWYRPINDFELGHDKERDSSEEQRHDTSESLDTHTFGVHNHVDFGHHCRTRDTHFNGPDDMDFPHSEKRNRGRRDVEPRRFRKRKSKKHESSEEVSCRDFGSVLFGITHFDVCSLLNIAFNSAVIEPIFSFFNATLFDGILTGGCPLNTDIALHDISTNIADPFLIGFFESLGIFQPYGFLTVEGRFYNDKDNNLFTLTAEILYANVTVPHEIFDGHTDHEHVHGSSSESDETPRKRKKKSKKVKKSRKGRRG